MAVFWEILLELIFAVPIFRAFVLAVIPALLLLLYVRKKDRLEPEPPKLIWQAISSTTPMPMPRNTI